MPTVRDVAAVLGGASVLGRRVSSAEGLVQLVREGLRYEALEATVQVSRIGIERLGQAIGLSRTTRARRRKEGRLTPEESDRLCRFARVFAHALTVFEDEESASQWLLEPIEAIGKHPPLEWMETDLGAQQIDEILGRLEHGLIS